MKITLFIGMSLISFVLMAFDGPRYCGPSTSPTFNTKSPNDLFEFELITDFSDINTNNHNIKPRAGILAYSNDNGDRVSIAVQISPRGNSRRQYCAAVPLRVEFDEEDLLQELVGDPNDSNIEDEYNAYIDYVKDNKKAYKSDYKGKKQYDNVFKNIGRQIKLVTHCGIKKGEDQWVLGAKSDAEHTLRLLQEHYLYALLDTLNTTTLKTRLSYISYKDPKGNKIGQRVGLIRETDSSLAKRCDLNHQMPKKGKVKRSKSSEIQTHILNALFYQVDYSIDGHNTFFLYSKKKRYVVPYDYDLSGIIQPDYFKNEAHHSENLEYMQETLNELAESRPEITAKILAHILDREEQMNYILENMVISVKSDIGLDATEDMLKWFDSYMQTVEDIYLSLIDND